MGDIWGWVSANESRVPQGSVQSEHRIIKDLSKSDGCHCLHIAANNNSLRSSLVNKYLPAKDIAGWSWFIHCSALCRNIQHCIPFSPCDSRDPWHLWCVTIVSQLCVYPHSVDFSGLWISERTTIRNILVKPESKSHVLCPNLTNFNKFESNLMSFRLFPLSSPVPQSALSV